VRGAGVVSTITLLRLAQNVSREADRRLLASPFVLVFFSHSSSSSFFFFFSPSLAVTPAPGEYIPRVDALGNSVILKRRAAKDVLPRDVQTFGTSKVRFRKDKQIGAGPGDFGSDWTQSTLEKRSFNVTRGARVGAIAKDRKQKAAAARRKVARQRKRMDFQDLQPVATKVTK
jgi:hypothetical protein|tara:strand:- start:160 stop:678 length:519 start_codon:yes stop_codon:yes gene_type:complete